MDKIKVLHIMGSSNLGGGEILLCNLLENIDKEKFEIYIVCPPKGNMIEAYRSCTKEVKTICVDKIWRLWTLFQLCYYIKNKKFNIVHTHLYISDFWGIMASKITRVPVIITTIHGYNFRGIGRFSLRSIKNFIFSFFYRIIYIFNDAVIAVCHAIKQDLATRVGIKIKPEKIKVIYNGIYLPEIKSRVKNTSTKLFGSLDSRTSLVGVIANFDPVKGHRSLIKAIPKVTQEVPHLKILLVGDGEERKFIENMSEKANLSDTLIFMGIRRNILQIISLCKLIVLPSLFEGFPLVIMEAMALGKPIVASNVGGIPEILEDGKTGILIPPNSPDHLSEAMTTILKSESQASRMGMLGRETIRVNSKFHLENMVVQTEKLYLELLRSKDKR